MAKNLRLICASNELVEAGLCHSPQRAGFGYFNECDHAPAQLDGQPGEFFDQSKLYSVCSIHGALYAPDTGRCLGGRCGKAGLKPLPVREIQGQIFLELINDHRYG